MDRPTLSTWQQPPYHRWAYQHVRELIPTERIWRGEGPPSSLTMDVRPVPDDLAAALAETWTDAFLVMHRGTVIHEHYETGMTPASTHLMQSVTKSVVSTVAGIQVGRGELDPEHEVSEYIPELEGTSFDGCTVRHLLDMRAGTKFGEDYEDPTSDVRLFEPIIGWSPPDGELAAPDLYTYITTLDLAFPHGDHFDYRSILTDTLGWVVERVGGASLAQLISREIWQPMGAEQDADITVDRLGHALGDGGMCASLRDLARFGELVRTGGGGIIPSDWIDDTYRGDAESRRAWLAGDREERAPDGHYRNKWWVYEPAGVMSALGIHGQMIHVDRLREVVVVKLSTWPTPLNDDHTYRVIDAVRATM